MCIKVYDSSCSEEFHTLFLLQGIMLVYDITNEKSFDNIKNWIRNIEEVCVASLLGFQLDR